MGEYKGKYTYEGNPHDGDPYRAAYLESVKRFIANGNAECAKTKVAIGEFGEGEAFMPPEKLIENPEKYRLALLDMVGAPFGNAYPQNVPTFSQDYVATDDMCEIYRLKVEVMQDFFFYGILMKPIGIKEKTPLIVAQHGGGSLPEVCTDMNGTSVYGQFARRALERGCTVFVPQLLLWTFDMDVGEKRVAVDLPYKRRDVDYSLRAMGLSITGLEIFCIRRSIDALSAEEYIDENRIGMMGLSYGGYYTLYTAALDTRIKSAYAAGFYNDRRHVAFNDWKYTEYFPDLSDAQASGLVAPRRLAVDVGKTDPVFDFSRAPDEADRARIYFDAYGAKDNFRFTLWPGGHKFDESGEGFEYFFAGLGL